MKSIVLGYDDTESAKRALERTAELATALHARVLVVGVAPVLTGAGRGFGPLDPVDPPDLHREQVAGASEELKSRGVDVTSQVAIGRPADSILEVAEAEGADLIVVGSRHTGLLSELFGASVSGSVKRRAHCDVLVVH